MSGYIQDQQIVRMTQVSALRCRCVHPSIQSVESLVIKTTHVLRDLSVILRRAFASILLEQMSQSPAMQEEPVQTRLIPALSSRSASLSV